MGIMSSRAGTPPPLPPPELRAGGRYFRDDEDFLISANQEVQRLQDLVELSRSTRVLDWGCGAGRLAVGLKSCLGGVDFYLGVDVRADVIRWARRNLGDERMRFLHVNANNPRYNPQGSSDRRLPAPSAGIDLLYAYSVLSHMLEADVAGYLHEIGRVLDGTGRAVVTAFVEENVPKCEENPASYGPIEWRGRLHCVRYERQHFESMISNARLVIIQYEHGRETDGQSLYVLGKPSA